MEKTKIKKIEQGIVNIFSTLNNTIVSISDLSGNILCWSSCGEVSIKEKAGKKLTGANKKTEHAAFLTIKSACAKCRKFGIKQVDVHIKNYGSAINIFSQAIMQAGLQILSIVDVTPIAFNGCRVHKKRRRKRHIKNKDPNYVKVRHTKTFE